MDGYFSWLCSLACPFGGGSEAPPLIVFKKLFETPYEYKFPNDKNRAADGLALRDEYNSITAGCDFGEKPCSMLEMLVGLARRIAPLAEGFSRDSSVSRWFLEMIVNLRIVKHDLSGYHEAPELEKKLDIFVNRKIDSHGRGGLFPLICPERDQRKLEVWYQMCDYLKENCEF